METPRTTSPAQVTPLPILNAEFMPDPEIVLQRLTARVNATLAEDLQTGRLLLSGPEYRAAQAGPDVARLFYGKAVERLVAEELLTDPILRKAFEPAGIGRRGPDIIGIGVFKNSRFEITTSNPRTIAEHFDRPYGRDLIIITYERPVSFVVFPE